MITRDLLEQLASADGIVLCDLGRALIARDELLITPKLIGEPIGLITRLILHRIGLKRSRISFEGVVRIAAVLFMKARDLKEDIPLIDGIVAEARARLKDRDLLHPLARIAVERLEDLADSELRRLDDDPRLERRDCLLMIGRVADNLLKDI